MLPAFDAVCHFRFSHSGGSGVVDHGRLHSHLSDDKRGPTPLFIGHLDIFFCWWFAQGFFPFLYWVVFFFRIVDVDL